jgi:hypothetical protein
VQSFQDQLVSPFHPAVFTNANGPLFSIPIGSYPGVTYPVIQWVIIEWLFVIGIQYMDQNLIYISNPNSGVYWGDGMPLSTWIYIGLGAKVTGSYFFFAIVRGQDPYLIPQEGSLELTTSTVYQGSDNAVGFTVRGYTGLLSRRENHY